jgi:phage terminase large subunit-like protein
MDEHQILALADELSSLPEENLHALTRRYEWLQTARRDQLPPARFANSDALYWLLMAGRGAGKTRAGAEHVWWENYQHPQRFAVVAPTTNDIRKTCFEGESGLLSRIPPELVVNYNRTSLELWTKTQSGETSYYVGYSAQEPERLRGPQHHGAWTDELGSWDPIKGQDTMDMLLFGLRLGPSPRIVITTTPRTNELVRRIMRDEKTVRTHASTYDNRSNLPQTILDEFRRKYEGTRLGRQELYAELLEDIVGALWTDEMIIHLALDQPVPTDTFARIVVAVDPSGSKNDSIGIVVAAIDQDGHYWILADRTVSGSPAQWGRAAVDAYYEFGANRIVAEINYGGAMVESTIRNIDADVSYKEVRASRGKIVRAEPISALYEQHRVTHVRGLEDLEKQMMLMSLDGFQGEGSPDRVDALVWALTELSGRAHRSAGDLQIDGERRDEIRT